jgi:hypothetical protein
MLTLASCLTLHFCCLANSFYLGKAAVVNGVRQQNKTGHIQYFRHLSSSRLSPVMIQTPSNHIPRNLPPSPAPAIRADERLMLTTKPMKEPPSPQNNHNQLFCMPFRIHISSSSSSASASASASAFPMILHQPRCRLTEWSSLHRPNLNYDDVAFY